MKLIKSRSKFLLKSWVYKPALAAFFLGVSRLPIHLGFLVFIGLIPLFSLFDEKPAFKKLIVSAFVFSVVYTSVTLHWISLVTLPGYLGIYLVFGVYFLALFLLINFFRSRFYRWRFIIFILFWLCFEYVQNFGEFRFPWLNIGYSLGDYLLLVQTAEIGGVYLISVQVIIINILIYQMRKNAWKYLMFLILFLLIWVGYGKIRLRSLRLNETGINIALVQVSVPQDKKWETTYLDSTISLYETYTRLAAVSQPDLIIWPESALPVYLIKTYRYLSFVRQLAGELNSDIFTGYPDYEIAEKSHPNLYKFYNSAGVFYKTGKISQPYRKIFLVPFGERMPFLKIFPVLWNIQLGQANFEFGEKLLYYKLGGYCYSPLICFEIVFPKLSLEMAESKVDFIVNITNDAWFKRSAGTYQHAVMSRFRTIETRKQIYRCANTGYSFIVLPTGEYLHFTELYEKTTIEAPLYIYPHTTFYVEYLSWFPLIAPVGILLLAIVILVRIIRRKGK